MRADRIGIQSTRANFTGFSDVLALSKKDANIGELDFIAMKLDNNGTKDLDTFRDLKKRLKCAPQEVDRDLLFFMRMTNLNGEELFSLDANHLLSGKSLVDMNKMKAANKEDAVFMDIFKMINVKIYTFLLDLTKRISDAKGVERSLEDTVSVSVHSVNKITELSGFQPLGIFMVTDAMNRHDLPTYQGVAKKLNQSFKNNLELFLKNR